MKIDSNKPSTAGVSGDTKARSREASPAPSAATAAAPKVQISSFASGLQQLEKLVGQSPVVDSAKVDEIKQAISQGQFEVHADKVADGLIDSVRQLLAAQPRTA